MIEIIMGFVCAVIIFIIDIFIPRNYHPIDGGVDKINRSLFHGSDHEITELVPQVSNLTKNKVVFGTPKYLDAVIFLVLWTDYNWILWGDGKVRYLEEQYPGAFDKLDTIGYIHHIKGDFKPLGSGLEGEYICEHAVKPYAVDKVNVLEYLRKQDNLNLVMQKFEEGGTYSQKIHIDNAIAHIVFEDAFQHEANDKFIKSLNFPTFRIGQDNEPPTGDYIIVGDPILSDDKYIAACPHYLIKADLTIAKFPNPRKTTANEYMKYLNCHRNQYHAYWWMVPDQFTHLFKNVLLRQLAIKKKYPDIVHIDGAPGSGKTTLCNELIAKGKQCIDLDDITDKIPDGDNRAKLEYDALESHLEAGARIFAGLSMDMSVLANKRYYLDTPPTTIYKRATIRTIDSICKNADAIKHTINESTDENINTNYHEIVNKYQIRLPGIIEPWRYIGDAVTTRQKTLREQLYEFKTSDEILGELLHV